MFWMAAGIPLLPALPALGWDPAQLAEEGIGERGDGVPVLLEGGRSERTGQSRKPPKDRFPASETVGQVTKFQCVLAKMTITSTRSKRYTSPSVFQEFIHKTQ